jgi:hypothetical protein
MRLHFMFKRLFLSHLVKPFKLTIRALVSKSDLAVADSISGQEGKSL